MKFIKKKSYFKFFLKKYGPQNNKVELFVIPAIKNPITPKKFIANGKVTILVKSRYKEIFL